MSERRLERILQEEADEAVVQEAIDEYLGTRRRSSEVPGGHYYEPGWEDANSNSDRSKNNYPNMELPF